MVRGTAIPGKACLRVPDASRVYAQLMDRGQTCELEGQTSINELLDDPVGTTHIQMVLPIYLELRPGEFRHLS